MKPAVFSALALLATASFARSATTLSFYVDLDVSGLSSAPAGPYFLDFQLTSSGNTVINTTTVSGFTFTGGSGAGAVGSSTTYDNASGSLAGTVTLDNTGVLASELYQGFSGATTGIRFLVTTTLNEAAGVADCFSVQILDSSVPTLNTIPTNAGDGLSLVKLSITQASAVANVERYAAVGASPVPTAVVSSAAVPEPSVYGLLGATAAGAAALARRRNRRSRLAA